MTRENPTSSATISSGTVSVGMALATATASAMAAQACPEGNEKRSGISTRAPDDSCTKGLGRPTDRLTIRRASALA